MRTTFFPWMARGMLALYITLMIGILCISYSRRSGRLGLDMAKVQQMRVESGKPE